MDGGGRQEGVRFSEAVADEIVARVAGGEGLDGLGRDPTMPSATAIHRWRRLHPAFGAELAAAQREARAVQRRVEMAMAAERLIRPRRYGPDRCTYTPEMGAMICERLANGESLVAILADEGMPAPATVYGWLKRHPQFGNDYAVARRFHGDYLFDEAREVALSATPQNVWARRLHFDVIRWQAARLAPVKYSEPLVARNMLKETREKERPFVVVVRRFTDPPNESAEDREAMRRGRVHSSESPLYKVGEAPPEGWDGGDPEDEAEDAAGDATGDGE